MSASTKPKGDPEKDPYTVLGLSLGASDAEVAKAYRKLAVKLHPDKLSADLSDHAKEQIALQFHDIQQARAFLLDDENKPDRAKYDAKRASERLRKHQDEAREKGMSERRKRMRDQLREQEDQAKRSSEAAQQHRKHKHEPNVDALRKQGSKFREMYGDRAFAKEQQTQQASERNNKKLLENRQIRLKWSRKKLSISPSEHSLAALLSKFGHVERVEMIGSKGNAALVTFTDPGSCAPCVDEYLHSDEMRASFVGDRNDQRDLKEHHHPHSSDNLRNSRDDEHIGRWKLRQAAERERLIREMEQEEEDKFSNTKKPPASSKKASVTRSIPFPPDWPTTTDEEKEYPALVKLERIEQIVLHGLLSDERLQQIRLLFDHESIHKGG